MTVVTIVTEVTVVTVVTIVTVVTKDCVTKIVTKILRLKLFDLNFVT